MPRLEAIVEVVNCYDHSEVSLHVFSKTFNRARLVTAGRGVMEPTEVALALEL